MSDGVGRGQGELELIGGNGLTGGRRHGLITGMLDGGDRHRFISGLGSPGGVGRVGRRSQPWLGGLGRLSAALSGLLRGVSRGMSSGGGVPSPARAIGRLRLGSRDGERGGAGLGADLLAGLWGAQHGLRLGLLLPVALRSGQGRRHLNHRGRRHGRCTHLTVHKALLHGEGLDEEGLPRRRGDRFGLGRRDRLPKGIGGLSGLGRRVGGHRRVPGLVSSGRVLLLGSGDRLGAFGVLGLGRGGLLDLRGLGLGGGLLDEGLAGRG